MSTSCSDILVVIESVNGTASDLSYELLGLARRLSRDSGGRVWAATLEASDASCIGEIGGRGADRVFCIAEPNTGAYDVERWLPGIGTILKDHGRAHVLVGHSALGAELGPRLALRLGGAVATACERVEFRDGKLVVLRPCFGGKAREAITLHTCPAVATVRARMYEPLAAETRTPEVVPVRVPADDAPRTKVVSRNLEAESGGVRLETAKIVIAGGRGIGAPEGFAVLERLAATVGGAVGASRVACDLGWCAHSRQIGLSGKTVSPDLYVAVGISGASQHMAGCGRARAILAINSDPEAAIFKEATFGIVGDYRQIVPALIEALALQEK